MRFPGIIIGDTLTIQKSVTEKDTTDNYWTTHIENLFSTPSMVAMMQEAAVKLLDEKLPEGFISIGKSAEVTHEQPTVLGSLLNLKVEIKSFDGYHVRFKMLAYDDSGIVGRGSHVRSIVNERWMKIKVQKRIAKLQ
jgi:predicted thioesterase